MSSIIGSAEMLGEGMLGDLLPEQQRMVNVISRNGDRLLSLADDLLALATFDQQSWQDLDSEIDLRTVVDESAHAVASMLATRDLGVTYAMPPEPVRVNGEVVGRVTSGGYGFAVERSIAYAYLPPGMAEAGQAAEVEIFGEWVGCTVSAEPLFDPQGSRIKA